MFPDMGLQENITIPTKFIGIRTATGVLAKKPNIQRCKPGNGFIDWETSPGRGPTQAVCSFGPNPAQLALSSVTSC